MRFDYITIDEQFTGFECSVCGGTFKEGDFMLLPDYSHTTTDEYDWIERMWGNEDFCLCHSCRQANGLTDKNWLDSQIAEYEQKQEVTA
jgi:hypothetical protein